jgi:3-oxoacyl-[acyl-carrier protein] reductase
MLPTEYMVDSDHLTGYRAKRSTTMWRHVWVFGREHPEGGWEVSELRLEGKKALVTGAGHGMGRAYALGLGREGASVLVTDLDGEAAEAAAKEIESNGGVATAVRCDVADEAEIASAVDTANERFGGVDILVNNAGLHLTKWIGPFSSLTASQVRALFEVNVLGVVNMTQACRSSMIERGGGAIVNISSTSGYSSSSPYGVTKLAVRGLTVAFARELGPSGIRVNGIAPGNIYTDSALAELGEDGLAGVQAGQVIDVRGECRDVVETMLFLVSDDARMITGETIKVAAGLVLHRGSRRSGGIRRRGLVAPWGYVTQRSSYPGTLSLPGCFVTTRSIPMTTAAACVFDRESRMVGSRSSVVSAGRVRRGRGWRGPGPDPRP